MRVHLLAPPNTQTTKAYSLSGFTQVTIRFARILKDLGHTVFLYASEENEAPCDELITCVTKAEIHHLLHTIQPKPIPYQYAAMDQGSLLWQAANWSMIDGIRQRKQPDDFICTIAGVSQQPVALAHPDLRCVEYSIGYPNSFSAYKVFESAVYQHYMYGVHQTEHVRFYDTVIPIPFDETEYPYRENKDPFVLYVGRIIEQKGIEIACQAAVAAGVPLKVIGHGDASLVTHGAEYLGTLEASERNDWMARAQAVLTPTLYIEPFNAVAVEAQLCGTPVISTDIGGFVETVEHGRTGFRCDYAEEFTRAIHAVTDLDPAYIRRRAVDRYSMRTIAPMYQRYFERLLLLPVAQEEAA